MIRIGEWTTADEVLGWTVADAIEIQLTKQSSFEPGAQGLALSYLRGLSMQRDISVVCAFKLPDTVDSFRQTPFSTPFGISLARLCTSITFDGTEGLGRTKALISAAFRQSKGVFASGSAATILSLDPHLLCPSLIVDGHSLGTERIHVRSLYQKVLGDAMKGCGFENLFSICGSTLLDFVQELYQNTEEHAVPSKDDPFRRSTRAISIEKLASVEAVLEKRTLSRNLSSYLQRVVRDPKWMLGLGFCCITVADQGRGIQRTLPAKDNETEAQRLVRAFAPGESRKPKGKTERGAGLGRALSAAYELEGFIQILSGGLFCVQDQTIDPQKYPGLTLQTEMRNGAIADTGTAFSIVVPEYKGNPAQRSLSL